MNKRTFLKSCMAVLLAPVAALKPRRRTRNLFHELMLKYGRYETFYVKSRQMGDTWPATMQALFNAHKPQLIIPSTPRDDEA